ncbi:MAG TPA: hypothetical protein DEQ09_01600 [Bacteroidales bacterium]|nr:hypothetical protein [Bacteroidales bacterium]
MQHPGYNFSDPDEVYVLPASLKEISGITVRDDNTIACIHDEYETIYIYDIKKNRIIRELTVGGIGDFEGLARVNSTLFILRSDGLLSEIMNYESADFTKAVYDTGVPWKDNEGLCYDRYENRLLIGPKSIPGKKSPERGFRFIYGFNLDSKKLDKNPAFVFDMSVIEKFADKNNIEKPLKHNKPNIKFRISALGIHPLTDLLYIVSARDSLLFIFDRNGNIKHIVKLDRKFFWQPEGITFMKNGDMLISNEGKKKKKKPPTLVRFNHTKF